MKKLVMLVISIGLSTFAYSQNQWAKEDAKWWYISESDFGFKFPYSYEFIGMEDIAGKNC